MQTPPERRPTGRSGPPGQPDPTSVAPAGPIRADPADGPAADDCALAGAEVEGTEVEGTEVEGTEVEGTEVEGTEVERIAVRVVNGDVSADLVVSADAPVQDLLAAVLGAAAATAPRVRLVRVDAVALPLGSTVGLAGIRPGEVLVVARPGRPAASRQTPTRRDETPSPGHRLRCSRGQGQRLRRYAETHPRARSRALAWVGAVAAALVAVLGAVHPQGWRAAIVGVSLASPLASVAPRLALASHPLGGIDGSPGPGNAARLVGAVRARQGRLVATASASALAGTGLLVTSSVRGGPGSGGSTGWVLAVAGIGLAVLSTRYRRRDERTLLTVAATSASAGAVLTMAPADAVALAAVVLGLLSTATMLVLPTRGYGAGVRLRLHRLAGVVLTIVVAASLPLALVALGVVEAVRAASLG